MKPEGLLPSAQEQSATGVCAEPSESGQKNSSKSRALCNVSEHSALFRGENC
jgi:hypothetical protein